MELMKIAWAAGFVDGEGYIGITRAKAKRGIYYRVDVQAAQIHEEPIRLLQSIFGGNVRHVKNHKRGYWYWRTFGPTAIKTATILLPFLVVKKRQAQLVVEFQFTERRNGDGKWKSVPEDIRRQRAAMFAACCELNGGRALQAERLSEEAPALQGDAIVRSDGNDNRQSREEIPGRLRLIS